MIGLPIQNDKDPFELQFIDPSREKPLFETEKSGIHPRNTDIDFCKARDHEVTSALIFI